jgi:hypothetical protein
MAKGRYCYVKGCNHYMFAIKEDHKEQGTYVTYQCRSEICPEYLKSDKKHRAEVTVFEDKSK